MIAVYVMLIRRGLKTLSDVPITIRNEVKLKILEVG
jgi:hypothetical protein